MWCGAASTNNSGQLISTVQYHGTKKDLYFKTVDGTWKTDGCNPTYVHVKPTIEGQKEILSIGLAAKMSGKKVWFIGDCASHSTNYFEAYYIVVM